MYFIVFVLKEVNYLGFFIKVDCFFRFLGVWFNGFDVENILWEESSS